MRLKESPNPNKPRRPRTTGSDPYQMNTLAPKTSNNKRNTGKIMASLTEYKHHWEFPKNEKITPLLTSPIDLFSPLKNKSCGSPTYYGSPSRLHTLFKSYTWREVKGHLHHTIGRGGFGCVYKANIHGFDLAVKKMRYGLLLDRVHSLCMLCEFFTSLNQYT